ARESVLVDHHVRLDARPRAEHDRSIRDQSEADSADAQRRWLARHLLPARADDWINAVELAPPTPRTLLSRPSTSFTGRLCLDGRVEPARSGRGRNAGLGTLKRRARTKRDRCAGRSL